MSTVQFIVHCSAVVASKPTSDSHALAFSESKIHTIGAAIRELRSQTEMRKLLNRKVAEQGRKCGTTYLPNAVRSSLTIASQEELGEQEETIFRITSRLCIDGATDKRARQKTG